MKIPQIKEIAISFIQKDKKRVVNIAIFIVSIAIACIISVSQGQVRKALSLKRDAEIKRNELLSGLSQSEKTIESYREALIHEKDAPAFVNTINSIAKEMNVEVLSIKPEPQIQETEYIRYHFIVIIQADNYHAIGKFIARIEGYSESNFVQTLSIKTLADKLVADLALNLMAFKN